MNDLEMMEAKDWFGRRKENSFLVHPAILCFLTDALRTLFNPSACIVGGQFGNLGNAGFSRDYVGRIREVFLC
jgi:hypothetical protein